MKSSYLQKKEPTQRQDRTSTDVDAKKCVDGVFMQKLQLYEGPAF